MEQWEKPQYLPPFDDYDAAGTAAAADDDDNDEIAEIAVESVAVAV